ncbi:hypothetical protein SAY87_000035 [Trapa incisa]|uniref:RING-type domain-containing protein n=2 Tax=Trapa TaxID=22665 RepID=A0AAN7MRV4_TRANT|nr:hypothetical protein SAY87_000035 [Trapa incisa]KAK4800620.1 hypothetical protein SAY86_021107 [Trapa natans]
MAVQAQYPSNVLHFNRNGQEGQDCSLQGHPGGMFLDHSHAMLNNGEATTSQRKRVREICGGSTENNIAGPSPSLNVHCFPTQPKQPPQLIEPSHLHNKSVSTGLRLSFADQKNHHQHLQHQRVVDNSSGMMYMFEEDLAAHVKQQREEIDQFIRAQEEQLRHTIAQKMQMHYHTLLGMAEEALARRLREKEAEVEKAKRKNTELQARAAHLVAQAQVWQARARSQEAAAASLRAHLEQAMRGGAHERKVDVSGSDDQSAEDAESVYVDPNRASAESGLTCRACRKRGATVLMLPCRHLSACTECDRAAHVCPLCSRSRSSSIEVYLP